MSPTRSLTTGLLVLVLFDASALAQEDIATPREGIASPQEDRFRLSAGVFSASANTQVRLDADDGTAGTELSAEDDLGYRDRSEVGNVEVDLRIRNRHHARFNYWRFDRKATITLAQPIRFGNDVYAGGDTVNSSLDIRNFAASYAFDVLHFDRVSLGVGLGINLVEFQAHAAVTARRISEDESRTGPFPSVGVQTLIRISERFHFEARGEYMNVEVDDYEGTLTNLHAALLYRFNRNLGAGLGYTSLDYDVVSRKQNDAGEIGIKNAGGELFLRVSF